MVVGEVPEGVDLLVVGAGPGGYAAALRAARLGRQVTLVDRDGAAGVGGVCLRTGCIPSKALIEVANTASRAHTMASAGLRLEGVSVDLAQFQRFKDEIVQRLGDAVRRRLDSAGVRVLAGRFCFTRPGQGAIQRDDGGPSRFVEFRDVILATGSRPRQLKGMARDGVRILDSTDVLALRALPPSAAVIGGGCAGVELGTALAKLGARVTIVEARDPLLPAMDAAVARVVQRRLGALGVEVLLSAHARDFDGARLKVETALVPKPLRRPRRSWPWVGGRTPTKSVWSRSACDPEPMGCSTSILTGGSAATSQRSATSRPAPRSRTRPPPRPKSQPTRCAASPQRSTPRRSPRSCSATPRSRSWACPPATPARRE